MQTLTTQPACSLLAGPTGGEFLMMIGFFLGAVTTIIVLLVINAIAAALGKPHIIG